MSVFLHQLCNMTILSSAKLISSIQNVHILAQISSTKEYYYQSMPLFNVS